MARALHRRELLRMTGSALTGGLLLAEAWGAAGPRQARGVLVGEPTATRVADQVFTDGGNAFDAIVAGAFAAAVAAPYQVGIGGYGGSATLVTADGKRVASLDFNTAAPAAARADMFQTRKGELAPNNAHGWLAAGVPGIPAGLQLLLDRFGSRKLPELVAPAIALARDGFVVQAGLATAIANSAKQFAADPGSRRLYFVDDRPLRAGERFRNPQLADLLAELSKRGSVAPFYEGEIAGRIADAFRKNNGLVSARDLSGYAAREVTPLSQAWGDLVIHTAPLTAGGITVLQAMRLLHVMGYAKMPANLARTQSYFEALRLAWRDRLTLLGDPRGVKDPTERLLSEAYAKECAGWIEAAIKAGRPLAHAVTPRPQNGTIHLSAADRQGNFAAVTLTHGDAFGARVTVDGLGLTLGAGLARFERDPRHPNAPGAGKRPLHNMCPTIVTRRGQPILAVGGRGGRRIPNAVFDLLTQFVVLGRPLSDAMSAPRVHTEGNTTVFVEKAWQAPRTADLEKVGYTMRTGPSAVVSAVAFEKEALATGFR